jgi:HK97 family phage prohead protease
MEKRLVNVDWELRSEDNTVQEIVGIGAVVESRTDLGWFEETVKRGAFDGADMTDVVALFNHDPNQILGRTSAGTATVSINEDGNLRYSFIPDMENPVHKSVVRSIQRGDIKQSSFAFSIKRDGGSAWLSSEKYGDMGHREIRAIDKVYDVSPVTYPAYSTTSVSARDEKALKEEREALKIEQEDTTDYNAIYTRKYYENLIK